MKFPEKLILAAILLLFTTTAGAATETSDQMFRIEFTVYDNHTFTYLEADTVEGSEYLPYGENDRFERYDFEFLNVEDEILHNEEVYLYFSEFPPLAEPGEPTMTSKYIQIPVIEDADELRITRDDEELANLNLVNAICMPKPTGCNTYCANYGIGSSCQSTDQNDTNQSGSSGGSETDPGGEETDSEGLLSNPVIWLVVATVLVIMLIIVYCLHSREGGHPSNNARTAPNL